jgi:hypothetical protein
MPCYKTLRICPSCHGARASLDIHLPGDFKGEAPWPALMRHSRRLYGWCALKKGACAEALHAASSPSRRPRHRRSAGVSTLLTAP